MYEWQSIPSDEHSSFLARYFFNHRFHVGRVIFLVLVVLMGIGLISSPHGHAHADTNVNMSSDQFNAGYQNAQSQGWQTGNWGTAPYYIDNQENMYIGSGQLLGTLINTIGSSQAQSIHTINIDGNVQLPQDSSSLFETSGVLGGQTNLTHINGLDRVDASQATTLAFAFYNNVNLQSLDLNSWDISNVGSLSSTFSQDESLRTLNISNWNTSVVQSMDYTFLNNTSLQSLDLSDWNTHNVTNMDSIFFLDHSLTHLNVANWDTTSLTSMQSAFSRLTSLTYLDLSNWTNPNLINMNYAFSDNPSLQGLNLNNFITTYVSASVSTFANDDSLTNLNLGENTALPSNTYLPNHLWESQNESYLNSSQLANSPVGNSQSHPGNWQTNTFLDSVLQAQQNGWQTGNWGTAPYYIDNNENMHIGAGQLSGSLINTIGSSQAQSIHTINIDGNVQLPQDSSSLFETSGVLGGQTNLTHINGLDRVDASQATTLAFAFYNNVNLQSLDLNSWDISNVSSLSSTFSQDESLNSLNISNWDTSNVQAMDYTFLNNTSLPNLDLSRWNTHNVTNMNSLFFLDHSLSQLNISNWDVSNVTNMQSAFSRVTSLSHLDLSNWDAPNLNNANFTFSDNPSLQELKLNNFNTNNVDQSNSMFANDYALANLSLGSQVYLQSANDLPNRLWENSSNSTYLNSGQLNNGQSNPGDWQVNQFASNFQQAQQDGQPTGFWGTAPWYIDNNNNMHVNNGRLQGDLYHAISPDNTSRIKSIDIEGKVQAPSDSTFLFSTSNRGILGVTNLQSINGLDQVDTSHTQNMNNMFSNDAALKDLNLSNWNISNVKDSSFMFWNNSNLSDLNISGWDTTNVANMNDMFDVTKNLYHLDLGNKTYLKGGSQSGFAASKDNAASFTSSNQTVTAHQLEDGNAHPGDWKPSQFFINYQSAQQQGRQTGFWGSSPYYIDNDMNMYVGSGQLLGRLSEIIGANNASSLHSLSLEGHVQAPQDSSNLLSTDNSAAYNESSLTTINGLSNLDTSRTINMQDMFYSDTALSNLDLSSWDTANVSNMLGMFTNDSSLQHLNMNGWNTANVNNMYTMFANDTSLIDLNLSTFNTSHANTSNMFGGPWTAPDDNLSSITLGDRTHLYSGSGLPNVIWQNNATHLSSNQLADGDSHPGNWQLDSFYQNAKNESNRGTWGTAPWYIDSNHNMYIGAGQLQGHLYDAIGSTNAAQVQSINFDESVQAPQDSSFLLSTSNRGIIGVTNLQSINGLDKINTSQVQSMNNIFSNDAKLTNLDLTSWDLSNVKDLSFAFWDNTALNNLNISDWDTSNVNNMNDTFDVTKSLYHLNLGEKTYLKGGSQSGLSVSKDSATSFASGNQTITPRQLEDGNAHPGDWTPSQFFINYQAAQRQGWQTGLWGTAPYYIDNDMSMHVGSGQLNEPIYDVLGDNVHNIKTINLDENVRAPDNSLALFSGRNYHLGSDVDSNQSITAINGLDKLNVSNVYNFHDMFYRDVNLNTPMNLNNWDTSNVNDMGGMFGNTNIPSFDINNWNVSNNTTTAWMFYNDTSLHDLNLDNWHTSNLGYSQNTFSGDMNLKSLNLQNFKNGNLANYIFFGTDGQTYNGPTHNLEQLTLGDNTRINNQGFYFPGATWTNGKDLLSRYEMDDGNPHPGTWHLTQFAQNYRYAKQHGWQYGNWGNAPWYIDPNMNMHIGKGRLQGSLNSIVPNMRHQLQSINIDEPVQAPQNSTALFASTQGFMDNDYTLKTVNGLNLLDTSQVTNMNSMFYNDTAVNHLDVSNWDTSKVQDFSTMFTSNNALTDLRGVQNWNVQSGQSFDWMFYGAPWSDLDLSNWQTPNAKDMTAMFEAAGNLHNLNISNFDTTHAKVDNMFGNDTRYNLPSDAISNLSLGNKTVLQNNAGLSGGIWSSDNSFLDTFQLMDGNSHPGNWRYYPVQNINDLSGTTDDKLRDLIGSALHLSNDDKQFQIINDQGSQDSQGDLKEGNYSDLTFVHIDANGNPTFYRTNLSVHPYVKGPDLQASVGQTTNFVLYNAVQNATGDGYNPSHLDDDGGSTNNGNHLQYGDYTIKYRYQDNSNNWQYAQSNLHVGQDSFASYLYVNDNNGTTPNDSDYMSQVGQFLGINPAVVHLNDGDGFPGQKGYTAQDNNQSFYGRIVTVPKMVRDLTMDHIPGASDAAWDHIIEDQFPNDADFDFNVTDNHIDSFQRDDKTGAVEVQGTVHPDNTRDNTNFANSPTIPYDFHVHPSTSDYSIDNTVNDKQVQDVINTVSDNSRVVKVTDGQGTDVTGAFGGLSSIPYNSNVTVTVDTGQGYANVHFAHINALVEPNVDITHNSVMDGSDINDNDLRGDIMGQTHENTMNGFSIDNSQMVSPNVREVDYHFTKDTVATGSSLDVKTSNNQVNGTAYIHYTNDDTSSTPTFTVTQGSNPVQHIENVTGHTVQITQAPEGKDINNLPVGSYDVAYQYTDMNDSELNANFFANITVIPNYYFSPVTNDSHFNNADSEAGYFKSYDYQNQGNSYKSVVDTQDHSKDNDINHGQNGSSNSSSGDMDTTVDGLHTQDGKPAHFNSSNPYK